MTTPWKSENTASPSQILKGVSGQTSPSLMCVFGDSIAGHEASHFDITNYATASNVATITPSTTASGVISQNTWIYISGNLPSRYQGFHLVTNGNLVS